PIPAYELTIGSSGSGSGSVTSSPSGIACNITNGIPGQGCSHDFAEGTVVTLNALAANGSSFAGWTGACSGTGSCQVTVHAQVTATATFTPPTHVLTVAGTGNGAGNVTSSPAGIACTVAAGSGSGACNAPFEQG